MEPDASPELELPDRGARALVRLGQERDEIEVGVPLDQPIEEVVGQHGCRRLLMVHGIERGGVDASMAMRTSQRRHDIGASFAVTARKCAGREVDCKAQPVNYSTGCAQAASGAARKQPALATMNHLRPSGRRGGSLPIGSVIGSLW